MFVETYITFIVKLTLFTWKIRQYKTWIFPNKIKTTRNQQPHTQNLEVKKVEINTINFNLFLFPSVFSHWSINCAPLNCRVVHFVWLPACWLWTSSGVFWLGNSELDLLQFRGSSSLNFLTTISNPLNGGKPIKTHQFLFGIWLKF